MRESGFEGIHIARRFRPSLDVSRKAIRADAVQAGTILDRASEAGREVVTLGKIRPDQSAFRVKYEPSNPASDAAGIVDAFHRAFLLASGVAVLAAVVASRMPDKALWDKQGIP